ncbi:MAG: LPS assembly lipoprotein LptE [Thermodesulfobacteriota bacterium]
MRSKRGAVIWMLLLVVIPTACGYRFMEGGSLPGGLRRITVRMFSNRTAETGLEQVFTNAVIYEFTRSHIAELVEEERAEAVLSGSIQSLQVTTASRVSVQTTTEMRISVYGQAKLTNAAGKTVWEGNGISVQETYLLAGDVEVNKREKLKAVARRFAEKVFQQLTMDF